MNTVNKKTREKVKPLTHCCKDCLFFEPIYLPYRKKQGCGIKSYEKFFTEPIDIINTCPNWQN